MNPDVRCSWWTIRDAGAAQAALLLPQPCEAERDAQPLAMRSQDGLQSVFRPGELHPSLRRWLASLPEP